jgi:outer membrane protein assembly factor BamD
LVVLLAGLAGCSGGNRLRHQSAEEAFNKGMAEYEDEDYERALRYFRAVFQYGRGSDWADDAQFYLGKTYTQQGKHLLAANEFQRFAQIYRGSQRVPEAEYERAMSYYRLSPQYQLDQTDTRTAISLFELFIERHPQHELVGQAQEHIQALRVKLARKRYAAGQLYEKREMWEAATQTYTSVFNLYPDTPWADDALYSALQAYIEYADRSVRGKQDDRLQKAITQYDRLQQLFPESKWTERAEPLHQEAQEKLERVRRAQQNQSSLASDRGTGSNS